MLSQRYHWKQFKGNDTRGYRTFDSNRFWKIFPMRKMSLEEIQGLVQNHDNTDTRRQGFLNQMLFEFEQILLSLQQYLLTETNTPKSSFVLMSTCFVPSWKMSEKQSETLSFITFHSLKVLIKKLRFQVYGFSWKL